MDNLDSLATGLGLAYDFAPLTTEYASGKSPNGLPLFSVFCRCHDMESRVDIAHDSGILVTDTWAQVNVGRNVGDTPMSTDDWAHFQRRIIRTLRCFANVAESDIMHTVGTGPWQNNEREDCASFGVFAPTGSDAEWLRGHLRYLAGIFDQDAIALMLGGELINATA